MAEWVTSRIRTIPDFPRPGVQFRDITTLLADPLGFRKTVDELVQRYVGVTIDKVVGIEARGFILGGAVAHQLAAGFVPVRKAGKLPHTTISEEYQLEYGTDRLELHDDAIGAGELGLLVDDLIAPGGTAAAAIKLTRATCVTLVAACCDLDLPDLGGSRRIRDMDVPVVTLCEYPGE